jgi:leader peptidase (prepilin peptidase)/N-methyltransferase
MNLEHFFFQLALPVIFIAALVACAVFDLRKRIIPNAITLVGVVLSVAINLTHSAVEGSFSSLIFSVLGALVCGGLLLIVSVISKGGMGMGDVKMAGFMGAYLRLANGLIALWLAIIVGGITGIILVLAKKATRKTAVPFAPFLAAGGIAAMFFADSIIGAFFYIR